MRRLDLVSLLSLAVAGPAQAGQPFLRATLPADHTDALRRGGFMIVHGYHHAERFPLTLSGTAEGIVDGNRRSFPLTFVRDTLDGSIMVVMKTWPDAGPWVLNIGGGYDSTRMSAGIVIGVDSRGVPVLVQNPRTALGGTRMATRREIGQLLAHLGGDRAAAPVLVDAKWRLLFTRAGLWTLAVMSLPVFLVVLITRRLRAPRPALKHALG